MLYCRRTKNKEQHFVGSICFRVPLLDICIMQSTAHRIHYLDHYSAGGGAGCPGKCAFGDINNGLIVM